MPIKNGMLLATAVQLITGDNLLEAMFNGR